jgi:uncharacterized SAM-binding protein YcdF (DUF218 family)
MRQEVRGVWLGGMTLMSLVTVLAWPPVAREAAMWLSKAAPPARSDLLVVVGGGARERLVTAARLHAAGFAPEILATGSSRDIAAARSVLTGLGVPAGSIVEPAAESRSTAEDALVVRDVTVRRGARSILAVTSPYHCRRLTLLLERSLRGTGVTVTVTASESLYFDLDRWWTDRQGWVLIPVEYGKLAWAKVTGTP